MAKAKVFIHVSWVLVYACVQVSFAGDAPSGKKLLKPIAAPMIIESTQSKSATTGADASLNQQPLQNTNLLTGMVGENTTVNYLIIENQSKPSQQNRIHDQSRQAIKTKLPAACEPCIK